MEFLRVDEALKFSLLLRPGHAGSGWRAELCGEDGVRRVFTTPIELLRGLADIGRPQPGEGGLR